MKCMTISYGTIDSFGGNNLSYVTAHLLIAEARPGPRSVQFSSFTPRCRQAPGGGGNCGRNVLYEHPRMSRVTVLNMTRTSRSRAPHLKSTSRWGEAGLVLTLKVHKQRRGGRPRRACKEIYHALSCVARRSGSTTTPSFAGSKEERWGLDARCKELGRPTLA
jgi:hypothetical protein